MPNKYEHHTPRRMIPTLKERNNIAAFLKADKYRVLSHQLLITPTLVTVYPLHQSLQVQQR